MINVWLFEVITLVATCLEWLVLKVHCCQWNASIDDSQDSVIQDFKSLFLSFKYASYCRWVLHTLHLYGELDDLNQGYSFLMKAS